MPVISSENIKEVSANDGGDRTLVKFGFFAWFVLGALLVAIIAHLVRADDLWWHILNGRLIFARHAIPNSDPFSFTFHGQPWVNWEWLFGVIAAFGWDRWGVVWLYFLRALTVAVCVIGTLRTMLRGSRVPAPRLALLLNGLMLLCLEYRVGDRPHMFEFALLALCAMIGSELSRRPSWSKTLILFVLLGL